MLKKYDKVLKVNNRKDFHCEYFKGDKLIILYIEDIFAICTTLEDYKKYRYYQYVHLHDIELIERMVD